MIQIKLNEKYKSFEENFETELEGKLIILSGVNGSGKSQLMNIISGDRGVNSSTGQRSKDLDRKVIINSDEISYKNIELRTFKDNISIPEIIKSSSNIFNTAADQAYSFYKQHGLNPYANPSFTGSIEKAIKLLKGNYDPNTGNTQQE